MLDGLLDTGDITTNGIVAALHFTEPVVQVGLVQQQLFMLGVQRTLLGDDSLYLQLQILDDGLLGLYFVIQGTPANSIILRIKIALLSLVFFVFFCRLRLAMQVLQLTIQLFADVGQTLQVLSGTLDAVFSIAAALLVFGDTCCLFNEDTQLFRLGLDQTRHHALFDDGVAAWTQAGAEENIGDVTTTTLGAV